jgi:hypothetical protein
MSNKMGVVVVNRRHFSGFLPKPPFFSQLQRGS